MDALSKDREVRREADGDLARGFDRPAEMAYG
jgi:hypothetical protein